MSGVVEAFNKFGVDPISRAVGIEPKGLASKVTGAFGLNPPETPAVPAPPAAPKLADVEPRKRRDGGRASTILAGLGVEDDEEISPTRLVLGAGY
jgi:hypothetical protein